MLSTLRALTFLLAPTSVLFVATALAVVGSPPIGVGLVPRQIDTLCEQYEWVTAGDFSLGTDFWGEASASSGSQCVYLDWDNGGNAISWQTSYTWEGDGSSVKSYANAGLTMEATQLSSISSLPTSWSWSYTGSGIGADVSYDAFISSTESTTATHDYEVMIWLAALGGAEPLGCCTAIATPTIGGITWNLYKGYNTWTVYSFVATSEQTDFSGDAMDFFTYLIDYEGIPSYYYLQSIAGGTEAFLGEDVLFTVSPFSLSLST